MEGIDIVSRYNIGYHFAEMFECLLPSGIEEILRAVFYKHLRAAEKQTIPLQYVGIVAIEQSVGVEPYVYVDIALVCLLYGECQRVVIRVRGSSLLTRKEVRPRLHVRLIKSVCRGAYLQYDSIDIEPLECIEHSYHRLLLPIRFDCSRWHPVDIVYGSYPYHTHLVFRLSRRDRPNAYEGKDNSCRESLHFVPAADDNFCLSDRKCLSSKQSSILLYFANENAVVASVSVLSVT